MHVQIPSELAFVAQAVIAHLQFVYQTFGSQQAEALALAFLGTAPPAPLAPTTATTATESDQENQEASPTPF